MRHEYVVKDRPMRFDVLTLFPEMFPGYLGQSLLKLAIERGLVDVQLHNIRDWTHDKHQSVDDRPFGGGPGMVMRGRTGRGMRSRRCGPSAQNRAVWSCCTPQGRRLISAVVEELAGERRLLLLCGRYEGFDERVHAILQPDEISIGDYRPQRRRSRPRW